MNDKQIRAQLLKNGTIFPVLARDQKHSASQKQAIEARRKELNRHAK